MRNELITFTDPKSPVSEMFRTLRTNLQFMGNSKKIQTVLITSTLPGEGKSWTSANLAVTFAQAGKKVVLIDADLRKGRQFSVFNVTARPGLSNYLSGVVNEGEVYNVDDIRSFIRETDVEDLYVIPAGDVPPNPAELLVNSRMNQLLLDLKSQYDIIIFDAPPALLVTDAIILARMVDTCMIVVAHQETKMDNLNRVQKSLKNVGGNVAGVVINKIPMTVKRYQDSYYGDYYGDPQDMLKARNKTSQTPNQDLYLRGKATILEDRHKNKEVMKAVDDNQEELPRALKNQEVDINSTENSNIKETLDIDNSKTKTTRRTRKAEATNVPMSETEQMLKRMNEYLEEQKRKMNS